MVHKIKEANDWILKQLLKTDDYSNIDYLVLYLQGYDKSLEITGIKDICCDGKYVYFECNDMMFNIKLDTIIGVARWKE